jgi:mono/diheme cytochrome c family protein
MKTKIMLSAAAAVVAFFGGALLHSACTSEEAPPASNAPATNAASGSPGHGAAHTNRLEGADLTRAQGLFKANCATCHLESGKGDPHHAKDNIPDFTKAAWHTNKTDAALTATIENGKGKLMPAFKGKLTSDEIALIVHYIHEFPERAGAAGTPGEPSKPPADKPTAREPKPRANEKPAPKPKKDDHSGHGGHP